MSSDCQSMNAFDDLLIVLLVVGGPEVCTACMRGY